MHEGDCCSFLLLLCKLFLCIIVFALPAYYEYKWLRHWISFGQGETVPEAGKDPNSVKVC
jgi:hypothetical protein